MLIQAMESHFDLVIEYLIAIFSSQYLLAKNFMTNPNMTSPEAISVLIQLFCIRI